MAKSTLQAIAAVIADRYELKSSDATAFVAAFFDQIREGLAQDKQVKVRGLGTFKLQPVKARESVNVNTGERLVINGHDKMAFTPDNAMKELVNRPFADFETVMIKDGVNIDAIPTPAESATDEDGDECTTETTPTETTPTETESESSAENHQPATEERPPVVDEGHTNRDEPQPVVKEVLPAEEEPLQAEEDHQPSVDKNPRATEEDLPHDEEIKARSDEEKSSSDKEQNEGKDEQPTVVNDQQVIETQTKEESPSAATVPTPPQRVVPRPRKPTPMERFSQLMGDDEDEEEQVHSNDDKAIVDDSDEKQESALESVVQSLVSEEVEQESPSFTSTHEATEKEYDSPEKAKTEPERETPLSDRADSDNAEESQADETCSEKNIEETLDAEETKDEVRTKGDVESTEENETIKATEEENSTVEEDSKVEENSTDSATEKTSLWADPENEDDKMETPQGHLVRNVVLPIVALLSVIAIATGAYYYGKSQQEIPQRPTTPEVEKPQSSAPQPAKANDSAQAKVENSTKTENKTEAQTDQAQKKEVVAESKETKQVTPEGIDLTAANNYRKLRYGAYRIIGVEKKVVLRPGETMEKVCRRTLGKDMIGYFEAINGQKRRSPGDTVLVPKVELRPEYRK
ncbi:MAG: HU family DNA-binding protein [Prevotella sp.]